MNYFRLYLENANISPLDIPDSSVLSTLWLFVRLLVLLALLLLLLLVYKVVDVNHDHHEDPHFQLMLFPIQLSFIFF